MRGKSHVLIAAALLAPAPAEAQVPQDRVPQLEYQADRHDDPENPVEEDARYLATPRSWSLTPWIPFQWNSNLAAAPRALRSGLAFEPEATVGRNWTLGPARLLTEASAYVSAIPSQGGLDSSGWWLTAEADIGDATIGFAPYAIYEPLVVHDGLFGAHAVTFHTLTAGVRRRLGPTNLSLFLRRRDSSIDRLDRTLVAAQLSRSWAVGKGLSFNLRADTEFRRYDAVGDTRRQDLFLRARSRLFIPLSGSAELVLTADVQRNRSNARDFVTTTIIIGPALSARFGL